MTIAVLVMAAGRGTRFADAAIASKLLVPVGGVPLVRRAVDAAAASAARPIIVVTGHAEAQVRAALHDRNVRFVSNPDYAAGLSTSLRAGIAALAGEADVAGALVVLADMPVVRPETFDRLSAAFAADPGCDAAVPVYRGAWGNPVLIARRLFPAVAALTGDTGARKLLKAEGRRVCLCPVDDAGVVRDVDVPEDLVPLGGAGETA